MDLSDSEVGENGLIWMNQLGLDFYVDPVSKIAVVPRGNHREYHSNIARYYS